MIAPLACDEHGFVRGVSYHDGELHGVLSDSVGREVQLVLRSSAGERHVVALEGVSALDVDGFRESNVVLDMRVLSAARAARDAEVRARLVGRLSLEPEKLPGDALVFVLDSSFGAQVLAVCGAIAIDGRALVCGEGSRP